MSKIFEKLASSICRAAPVFIIASGVTVWLGIVFNLIYLVVIACAVACTTVVIYFFRSGSGHQGDAKDCSS